MVETIYPTECHLVVSSFGALRTGVESGNGCAWFTEKIPGDPRQVMGAGDGTKAG